MTWNIVVLNWGALSLISVILITNWAVVVKTPSLASTCSWCESWVSLSNIRALCTIPLPFEDVTLKWPLLTTKDTLLIRSASIVGIVIMAVFRAMFSGIDTVYKHILMVSLMYEEEQLNLGGESFTSWRAINIVAVDDSDGVPKSQALTLNL